MTIRICDLCGKENESLKGVNGKYFGVPELENKEACPACWEKLDKIDEQATEAAAKILETAGKLVKGKERV